MTLDGVSLENTANDGLVYKKTACRDLAFSSCIQHAMYAARQGPFQTFRARLLDVRPERYALDRRRRDEECVAACCPSHDRVSPNSSTPGHLRRSLRHRALGGRF